MRDQSVVLLAAAADEGRRNAIRSALSQFAVPVQDRPPAAGPIRVVVVLSGDAVQDDDWLDEIEALEATGRARFIPVSLGGFDDTRVPAGLRDLNWVRWDLDGPGSAVDLFEAINGDPELYAEHRTLSAEAQLWAESGRADEYLLSDRRRVERAISHLHRSQGDTLARVTPTLEAFVERSREQARKHRRRSIRRRVVRTAITVFVAAFVVSAVALMRDNVKTNRMSIALDTTYNTDFPSRSAELAAATLIQGFGAAKPMARDVLQEVIPRAWGEGVLGLNHDAAIMVAAASPGSRSLYTADSDGAVTRWDRRTGVPLERHRFTRARLTAIDVASDGRRLAVAAGSELWVVDARTWRARAHTLTGSAVRVVIAAADDAVIAQTEDRLVAIDLDTGADVRTVRATGGALDLRRLANGHARGLVRRPRDEMLLVDPVSGRRHARAVVAPWRGERAAIALDGRRVVRIAPDNQIEDAPAGLQFKPTGLAAGEGTEVLSVLHGDRVAYGGGEFGIRVAELRSGLDLGEICTGLTAVDEVTQLPDEPAVICTNSFLVEVWDPTETAPVTRPPRLLERGRGATYTKEPFKVTGRPDGRLRLRFSHDGKVDQTGITTPALRWSAVTLHPTTLHVVAGTDRGRVVGFDVGDDGQFSPVLNWQLPDGARVQQLGWDAETAEWLYVRSASKRWWRVRACVNCSRDGRLVELARSRLQMCEVSKAHREITEDARKLLRLRVCPESPSPAGG